MKHKEGNKKPRGRDQGKIGWFQDFVINARCVVRKSLDSNYRAQGMAKKWGKLLFGDDEEMRHKKEVVTGLKTNRNVGEEGLVESRSLVVPNSAMHASLTLMQANIVNNSKRVRCRFVR